MRTLLDPATGELVEVLDEATIGGEPYDYGAFRASVMTQSRQHREAISAAETAGKDVASKTKAYRLALALAIPRMKQEHGATVAEAMAKGEEEVATANENLIAAQAIERAAMERVRLCRDDRDALGSLGYWSREANPDGWRDS